MTIHHVTAEEHRVAIECDGSGKLHDGAPYENTYNFLFFVRDGLFCELHEHFDTAYAHENGPHGIRVNAVCPGAVDTLMLAPAMCHAAVPEGAFKGLPLGRAADPSEVTTFIACLPSDEASYQTGCVYPVDGGRTI